MNRRHGRGRAAATMAGVLLLSTAVLVPVVHAGNVITVDTTSQSINTDGACSLEEAIYSANLDNNVAPDPAALRDGTLIATACAPGSGDDVIRLAAGATYAMAHVQDDAANYEGPTATPMVTSPITIEGAGAVITRAAGAQNMRAFSIGWLPSTGIGNLTIRNVEIKGFTAKGGNGAGGGGGGMGAGGAIYVESATLTIESSTFDGDGAIGGNGSEISGFTGRGGGGGGLGGNAGNGNLSGGGGGGARGDGAAGGDGIDGGGGGGGTVSDGGNSAGPRRGGFDCGANGGVGDVFNDGDDGCSGGGGGGGGWSADAFAGDGGNGGYGAGGGGGANFKGDGGNGGFGGGGGGANASWTNDDFSDILGGTGGDGDFGGGAGAGPGGAVFGGPGSAGTFAGKADGRHGGGGAALGGAIFGSNSTITVTNSTFSNNFVDRGEGGGGDANQGADGGGAIFAVDGHLTINNATIDGNASTGDAGGVLVYKSGRDYPAALTITNSIVADSSFAVRECKIMGAVTVAGGHNLYGSNSGCPTTGSITAVPLVKPLAIEAPGLTPTMAIDDTSPAYDAGDNATCDSFDQRGVSRPRSVRCDIGAYEYIKPSADLSVSTTGIGAAIAGTDAQFVVQLDNNGPTAAQNVVLTITPPAATTFVSISGSGGFSCTGTGPIVCTKALMLEGATALLTLTVHLAATVAVGTALTNTATVASTTSDPVPGNGTASVTINAATRADVSIAKSGPSAPVAGTDVSYSIVASNDGPSVATAVSVADTIPAGTTFQSLTAPVGWTCAKPAAGAPGPVGFTCTSGALQPAASASFTLVLHLSAGATSGGDLCNTATISTTTQDPISSNNASRTCGAVKTLADLSLTGSAATVGKAGKGTATFTFVIANLGPSDSQSVSLSASSSLFKGAKVTITTSGATCVTIGQSVTCSWASVAFGSTRQVVLSVPWSSSIGQICTSGNLVSGTADPNPVNSASTACIGKK